MDLGCEQPDEALSALTALKGIGPWTAEVYLMFCGGHADVFPAGDVALQAAVGMAFGMRSAPVGQGSWPCWPRPGRRGGRSRRGFSGPITPYSTARRCCRSADRQQLPNMLLCTEFIGLHNPVTTGLI